MCARYRAACDTDRVLWSSAKAVQETRGPRATGYVRSTALCVSSNGLYREGSTSRFCTTHSEPHPVRAMDRPRLLSRHVHGRMFASPHVGSVYLYLRRSETGLPLPEAPHASPTSTCAPGPPGRVRTCVLNEHTAYAFGLPKSRTCTSYEEKQERQGKRKDTRFSRAPGFWELL